MKKHLLMLFVAMIAATMSLKAQTIVIDDGFENGIQDSVWTQEFVVGEHPWAVEGVEDNLAFPATVYQGSKRAYLRNTSGETQGYITRLVSKVMDLSPAAIYQPQLTFWYANPKWTADRDTLRVLYKTGRNVAWKQLAEYSSASGNWQKVTLELPEVNSTYQIAFEGTDNLGRGIVLDSVKLRSAPQCTTPHDIVINNQGAGKINIAWTASWDANAYELILTTAEVDPDTVANIPDSTKIVAFKGIVPGLQQNYDLTLTSGEYYYVYLRSLCDGENSIWNSEDPNQGQYRFRVKATKNVPYSYGFNLPYDAGKLHRDLEWTWGGNTGKYNPFINTHQGETDRALYSKDASMAVVFSGANNTTTAIPAGKYAYLVTPALTDSSNANFALNQCQVRFWSTVHKYTGRTYAHSLIVGVMTDAEDVTTFVPVDTVSVWGTSEFVENIVDLSSYQGDGAYVAFVSNFDKKNLFYIDDITIEYKPQEQKVTTISVNPRDTYAEISWNGKASSYKVLITNAEVNPANPLAEAIVDQATVTTNTYKTEALEADHSWNRPYYVYVKAGDADWSYRYPFVTIASQTEVPYSFDFEQKDGAIYNMLSGTTNTFYPTKIGIFSNDPDYPHLYTTNYYKGNSCLYLTKDPGNDSWITLPPVDSLQDKQITFYLSGNTTPAQAHATVGIMTNPMDINTFIPVTDFTVASTGYTICYTNFANYTGPKGVIAIVWSDVEGLDKNTNSYIDELKVETIAQCLPPTNIVADAGIDSVTVTWDKSNATSWEFILAEGQISETQRNQTFAEIAQLSQVMVADTLIWTDPLTNPTFGFGELKYKTPYYIYMRTMCGEEEVTWWVEKNFITPCPESFAIPYFDDFDSYESVSLQAGCWALYNPGSTTYPKVMTQTPTGQPTQKVLELYSTGASGRSFAVLPAMAEDYSDLQLSFDARTWSNTATAKAVLYVGTMSDFADATTFQPLDTFYLTGTTTGAMKTFRMDLSSYKLANNNIVFTSGWAETMEMTTSDVALDNVSVRLNNCIEAWNISADVDDKSLEVQWNGKVQDDKWQITILNKYAALTDSNTISDYSVEDVVVKDSVITGKKFYVDGLKAVTKYYVYIRSLCGDSIWVCDSLKTGCVKLDPTKPNKETFENYTGATAYASADQPNCWIGGNGNPSATTTYLPFIYKGTSYATSGENTYRLYGTATYGPAYAASPEIDCASMTELAVTFSYYLSSSYSAIWGVMTDPEDLSTFVILDSIKGTSTTKNTITLDLSEPKYADSIPANAKYFAWRTPYGATGYLYLDDVSITKITCPITKPSYFNLKSESVDINSGLRANNPWEILILNKEILVDSLASETYNLPDSIIVYRDTVASGRTTSIEGLTEQTHYYGYTRSLCEEGNSSWADFAFLTPCKPLTPEALGTITFSKADGYVSGSSATRYLPCWTIGNMSGNAAATSTYIPYVYTTSTYLHNGDSVLRLYSYVPTSSTSTAYNGAYAIMPELDVQDITKYQVNFYARASTTATYGTDLIVGVVTDPSDLNTFTVVDTLTTSHTAYEPFSVSLENYEGDYLGNKGKYIMFLSLCTNVTYNDICVASVSVTAIPSCRPVKEFTVDSIAGDAAVISWKGYTEKYRLLVAKEAVADADKPTYNKWVVDSVLSVSDSVLIENLDPAQQYYVYAQGICGEGDSTDISMAYAFFTTLCPENGFAVPYKQDFEKYATNATVVDCWQFEDYVATSKTYPKVMNPTSGAVSGKQLELWSSSTSHRCVAIMPKIQGNLADYMLSFDARSYGVSTKSVLYIGTMNDVLDSAAGFAPFDTLYMDGGNEFYHKDLILADYAEKLIHSRIAFSSGLADELEMASDMYLDNVKIGMPPSCFAPTLEAGSSSMTSATILITPAKEWNNKWQLAVIPDSIFAAAAFDLDAYLDTIASAIVTADTVEYEITGLEPATVYQIYGRTVCGGEDGNSDWTNFPTKVRTKYYFKDSYFFGFEKSEGWDFCQNSTSATYYLHPALRVGYEGGTATTSYTTYYPYCMESTSSAIYSYGPKPANNSADGDWTEGKGVLRWNATASNYGGYIIFPSVVEAHDRSFEFKLRSGYLSFSTMKPSTTANVILEVGTVEKNKGYETYEVIATIRMPKLNTSVVASAANDYLFRSYTIDLDSATVADKQLVFRTPKQEASMYPYIDNVSLGEAKGFGLVSINKVLAESTQATVILDKIGGPWNLYILNEADTVAKFENTAETNILVSGLTPQTAYTAILTAANAPENTKYVISAEKEFKTPCLPLEANADGEFFWNFNDKSEWEQSDVLVGNNTVTDSAYFKPGCFTIGTTYTGTQSTSTVYYNWLMQRKGYAYTSAPTTRGTTATSTLHYEYGRNDSPALRVYCTSTYMTPYIVLPELNCSFDTMMIEFYGRPFANYDETYGTATSQNKILSASTYLGTSYSRAMIVGTLTDPQDFSTLEVIDTLYYSNTSLDANTLVTSDPNGLRYWEKMQLPLASAKGKYIVLFPPKEKSCLFFLDDLSIKPVGDNLFAPGHTATSEITKTTAEFSWEVKHPAIQSVVVVLNQEGTEEVLRDTVPGTQTTYTATGLNPNTGYQWYMYQTNGTVNTAMTSALEFYTQCETITPDYKSGFELEDGWRILPAQTSATYKQTMCWTYENAGTSAVGTNCYNLVDASSKYSHSGSYAAKIYAYSTTQQNYIAMPEIEDVAAYDTLQLNFYMRPTYVNSSNVLYATYLGATYSKAVIVGTMTDPMDPTTFVAIDTLNYTLEPGSNTPTEANDFFYEKKKVILTGAQGKYVTFMATLYAKGDEKKYTTCYMYIDDVSFSPVQHCDAPTEMNVSEITASAATLNWTAPEGAEKYVLQVSTDQYFQEDTAFVFNDTVDVTSVKLESLTSYTNYIWRVMTICGEDLGESEFSQNATFSTARTPYFGENFSNATLDADWSFATNPAVLVIDSTDVELTGANNTSYGWHRVTTNYGITGAHYATQFYSSSTVSSTTYDYYWMITPQIYLSDTATAHLTMDIALTGSSISTPNDNVVTESNMADDFLFMIVISEDGGKTWKKENIVAMWNNTLPAGNQLRDLPHNAGNLRVNLAKYAGKGIRVAFYREASTYLSATCALHIGNVRVSYYANVDDQAQACQYQDINQNGFYLDGDKAQAGEQTLTRRFYAPEEEAMNGVQDTIFTLKVNVLEAPETILSDTICEGTTYTDVNFTGKDRAGVYRRKLQSVESCDSIITLHLFVTPRAYAEDSLATLCPGQSITWNGKKYERAGLYRDTTISAAGCDSVMTLVLSYYTDEDTIYVSNEIKEDELPYTYEDPLHPYLPGSTPISYPIGTAPGTYQDTVYVMGNNCAAVLVHTLEITKAQGIESIDAIGNEGTHKVIYRDRLYIISNGKWYNAEGKKVKDPRK